MFEAMYAVMIRMKLIKYSTVGLLSLSLLISHSVPIKAEMHNMTSKRYHTDFTAVTNGQTHAQEWAYGCSYCSYEPIMSGFTYSQGTEAGGGLLMELAHKSIRVISHQIIRKVRRNIFQERHVL